MNFVIRGVVVSTVLIIAATPGQAKPTQPAIEFDRHAVDGFQWCFPPSNEIKRKPKLQRQAAKPKKNKTISLVRPVVAPKRFVPVDPTDTLVSSSSTSSSAMSVSVPQSGDLVKRAMRYLGTNPTGWARVWCGKFMAMLVPHAAGRVKNPNWARDWAALPHVKPRRGAIAVLTRGKGGHIGVIMEVKKNGDLVLVSGNHGRKVGIGVYKRSRLIAAVQA